jgi:hypothetical protein
MYTESIIVHVAECLAQSRSLGDDRACRGALLRIVSALRNLVAVLVPLASRFGRRRNTASKRAPAHP